VNYFSGNQNLLLTQQRVKLIDWCNQGVSIDRIKEEINACETPDAFKELVYMKYPNLSTELYPVVMAEKKCLIIFSTINLRRRNYSKLKSSKQ
jgi:hypothetical protein